jgi:hypothetical protein
LNPLDRDEGFQITSSSSLPELFLAQRPKTYTQAVIITPCQPSIAFSDLAAHAEQRTDRSDHMTYAVEMIQLSHRQG